MTSPRNSQSHLLTDFMVWTTVKIEQKGKGVVLGGNCVWPLEMQAHSTNTILRSNQGRDTLRLNCAKCPLMTRSHSTSLRLLVLMAGEPGRGQRGVRLNNRKVWDASRAARSGTAHLGRTLERSCCGFWEEEARIFKAKGTRREKTNSSVYKMDSFAG